RQRLAIRRARLRGQGDTGLARNELAQFGATLGGEIADPILKLLRVGREIVELLAARRLAIDVLGAAFDHRVIAEARRIEAALVLQVERILRASAVFIALERRTQRLAFGPLRR